MRYAVLKSRAIWVAPVDAVPVKEARAVRESLRLFGRRVRDYVVLTSANRQIWHLITALDPAVHAIYPPGMVVTTFLGASCIRPLAQLWTSGRGLRGEGVVRFMAAPPSVRPSDIQRRRTCRSCRAGLPSLCARASGLAFWRNL